MPKQKIKKIGPARSASSIMCSSTRRSGLSTVRVLARMWWKLIPSSYEKVNLTLEVALIVLYSPSSNGGSPSMPPVPNAVHHPPCD